MNKNVLISLITPVLLCATALFIYFDQSDDYEGADYEYLLDVVTDSGWGASSPAEENLLLQERIIFVNTGVNPVLARSIIRKLLILESRDPGRPIDLYLRTDGGWEDDAFAVIDVMQSISSPVHVHGIGGVYSAGCMIMAAATGQAIVYPQTILGFHTVADDEDEIFTQRYLKLFADHNIPPEWLTRRDDEMIYFTPEEALSYGIADTISPQTLLPLAQ